MYLNGHSYYSLRYGTMSVETLVERAAGQGIQALALTDINNSTGIMTFISACREHHIKPIAGIEFRSDDAVLYIGLAKNNDGFRELNEFLTFHNVRGIPLPDHPPAFENAVVIRPMSSLKAPGGKRRENEFIGVRPSDLTRLRLCRDDSILRNAVILASVTLGGESDYDLHCNLRAIDNNLLITRLEPRHLCRNDEYFLPPGLLQKMYADFPGIIRNTGKLTEECSIDFDFHTSKNKKSFTGMACDDRILLEKLAMDGMEYRYGRGHQEATRRIRHELEIISNMGFASYFLIAWDIIRYSMSRGFYHVGRGSGANSIIAYCLKITDVDPIDLDLYFERFINPKRTSPPDFDIDYSWKERDEVLDYIFKRHGYGHTALLGAMSTFKGNSIYRELGKVHGLPKSEMDTFLKHPEEAINNNRVIHRICEIGEKMTDFPNVRSIHAGGVLVSDAPINSYTALDLPPKGFPTTQWDMYVAEDIGFEKMDILSQRGIGHICETASIVRKNRGISVDVHDVERFKKDEKVKNLLRSARTIGCFYVESPAMRGLLKKLHCDNYRTLVAASSIIRPGVARSGMMKEYIYRFHHPGKFRYLHPVMEEQLKETFGVMVYQEDVLKICHHFAGLDLAEADVIRRAMSGKYRSKKELQRIIDRFFDNCRQSGYPEEVTKEVWRQIESFAGYSFSKAHSASYAVESYQSLFLKAWFPLEFMVGVINNFGGFYPSWVYLNEARICGGNLHPPCVNNSEYKTCIRGKDIYLGFIHVANLEATVGKMVVDGRRATDNGRYAGLEDFVEQVPVTLDQLIILIRTGAFRFTGKSKAALLWEAHMLLGKTVAGGAGKDALPAALFPAPVKQFLMPELEYDPLTDVYDEIEMLGFPVTSSWFDLLETRYRGDILAGDMMTYAGKTVRMLGLLVTIKYARTIKNEWMNFGTFLDVTGQFFDTVHFPASLKDYPFRGEGIYLVKGKIVEEFGFPSMEVKQMAKMPIRKDPRGG